MDKLSKILNQFSITAGVFYTGGLCGISTFDDKDSHTGHLHLLKSGKLEILSDKRSTLYLDEPSLVFYSRPTPHRLHANESDKAELVCATINYGVGRHNPLANALPTVTLVPLSKLDELKSTVEWLFHEAFSESDGRVAMMNRLSELLVIQLIRHNLEHGKTSQGLLAGLAHQNISRALTAIHEQPAKPWTLELMAAEAALSRSKFAELFKQVVGQTAADYLLELRIMLAQDYLRKGKSVGWVANSLGYETGSTFARVFRKKTGDSPKAWLKKYDSSGAE